MGIVMGFALGTQLLGPVFAPAESRYYWMGLANGFGLTVFLGYLLFGILGWSGVLQRLLNRPEVPIRASMRSFTLGVFAGVGVFAGAIVALLVLSG
jgi:hypothetical protein